MDDSFFRGHVNLIFDLLAETYPKQVSQAGIPSRGEIKKDEAIQINVDFTSSEDNFIILTASISLVGKAVTVYFSVRKYPKRSGQMSQTKMEEAFIKGLSHLLSRKYRYIIVADRGFGNIRFANLCESNGFNFVLRVKPELIIKENGLNSNLKSHLQNKTFKAYVNSWKCYKYFTIRVKDDKIWYLMSNSQSLDAGMLYEKRFEIEKNYQDCKSSGYNLEKNKIKKYDRFKRLLYCVILSQALTSFIGSIISNSARNIKKNSTKHEIRAESLSLRLILAFSKLDISPSPCILKSLCSFSEEKQNLS